MNYPFKIEIIDSQYPSISRSRGDSTAGIGRNPNSSGISPERSSRTSDDAEISIDIQFYSCEIENLESLRPSIRRELVLQVMEDAKRCTYDEFIHFLQVAARPVNFFPMEALRRYQNQRYSLLLTPRVAREVNEFSGMSTSSTDEILIFRGCELEINEHSQLMESEAYIVASNRYAIFLRLALDTHGVDVYRSDFIEVNRRTLPPIRLHSQIIIEAIQHIVQPSTRRRRVSMLLDIIQRNPPSEDPPPSKLLTECPKCSGRLKRLGGDDYFCLDCDWDNLKPM